MEQLIVQEPSRGTRQAAKPRRRHSFSPPTCTRVHEGLATARIAGLRAKRDAMPCLFTRRSCHRRPSPFPN